MYLSLSCLRRRDTARSTKAEGCATRARKDTVSKFPSCALTSSFVSEGLPSFLFLSPSTIAQNVTSPIAWKSCRLFLSYFTCLIYNIPTRFPFHPVLLSATSVVFHFQKIAPRARMKLRTKGRVSLIFQSYREGSDEESRIFSTTSLFRALTRVRLQFFIFSFFSRSRSLSLSLTLILSESPSTN